jgi:hypothetical protein
MIRQNFVQRKGNHKREEQKDMHHVENKQKNIRHKYSHINNHIK